MAKNLTTLTRLHKNALKSSDPFIWLFGIETIDVPAKRYRFASYPQVVEYGEQSDGTPIKWYPAPIAHGGIIADGDGSLPSIRISLANASLEIAPTVDASDGFVGQPVEIIVVSASQLHDPTAGVSEVAEVVDCSMTAEVVTFEVSAFNLFQAQFPPFLFRKFTCRWKWASAECAYDINATGAGFEDCGVKNGGLRVATGFTLDACRLVGDDEEANGNVGERQHPRRTGLFPSIPRPGRK